MTTNTVADIDGLRERVRARRELPPPAARRALRMAAKQTQAYVGFLVGVSPQTVALWEAGKREVGPAHIDAYNAVLRALAGVE